MTVYVIGCEGSHLVKIGYATDPEKRLREISTMSAIPLRLLWQSDPEHGALTEARLHRLFSAYRQHGEWFDFGDADPVALVSSATALPDPPVPVMPLAAPRRETEAVKANPAQSVQIDQYGREYLIRTGERPSAVEPEEVSHDDGRLSEYWRFELVEADWLDRCAEQARLRGDDQQVTRLAHHAAIKRDVNYGWECGQYTRIFWPDQVDEYINRPNYGYVRTREWWAADYPEMNHPDWDKRVEEYGSAAGAG